MANVERVEIIGRSKLFDTSSILMDSAISNSLPRRCETAWPCMDASVRYHARQNELLLFGLDRDRVGAWLPPAVQMARASCAKKGAIVDRIRLLIVASSA